MTAPEPDMSLAEIEAAIAEARAVRSRRVAVSLRALGKKLAAALRSARAGWTVRASFSLAPRKSGA